MASKLSPFRALRTLSRLSHSRSTSRYTPVTPLVSRQSPLPLKPLCNLRFSSTSTSTSSSEPRPEEQTQTLSTHKHKHKPHAPPSRSIRPPQPEYEMTFTCKPCGTRSSHRVSKQGYHFGSVLITCPECRNRHVISDHLNVSSEEKKEERVGMESLREG
jgi:protein import protein ZIM17